MIDSLSPLDWQWQVTGANLLATGAGLVGWALRGWWERRRRAARLARRPAPHRVPVRHHRRPAAAPAATASARAVGRVALPTEAQMRDALRYSRVAAAPGERWRGLRYRGGDAR